MKNNKRISLHLLGQAGCRLGFPKTIVYVDPYLSNSVQELDASDLQRLLPIPVPPENIEDADWVLITHDHIDHCDPHTLPQLAAASPQAHFMGPIPVLRRLKQWGIAPDRLRLALEEWQNLTHGLRVRAVPAAHPEIERDSQGRLSCVGYLLEYANQRIYLAGDTSVKQEIIDTLRAHLPIGTAFLPVNEQNFFLARRGIIGNMSIREAFHLAEELHVVNLIPIHWDMFTANCVDMEELQAVYRQMNGAFNLIRETDKLFL